MNRRTVLQSLGSGALFVSAGCTEVITKARDISSTSGPSTTTTSEPTTTRSTVTTTSDVSDRTLSVTRTVKHGQTGLTRVLRVQEGGNLTYELECPDGRTKSASDELPEDTWTKFKRLVINAEVKDFSAEYECTGDCPRDVPPTRLTFEIDGQSTDVLIAATADIPESLKAILTELASFEEQLALPTCEE